MSPRNEMKFPLGGDLYLTCAIWRGEAKVHIRKFTTLKNQNGGVVVVPTRYGVTMTVGQVNQLISALPLCLTGLARLEEMSTPSGSTQQTTAQPLQQPAAAELNSASMYYDQSYSSA